MLNKLRSKLKNKKGMGTIEFIVVMTIFIGIFGFFIDSFYILNQHYVASREVNIVTRQVAMQGGVMTSPPEGYNRFGQDYATGVSIHKRVSKRMAGVGAEDYRIMISPHDENGASLGWQELNSASNIPLPYQENFELALSYKYKWNIMSQIIPGMDGERTTTLVRSGVSELGGGYQ